MRNDLIPSVSTEDRLGGDGVGGGEVGGGEVGGGGASEGAVIEGVEGMMLAGDASTDGMKPSRGKKNKPSSSSSSSSLGPLSLPTLCAVIKGHLLKERHGPNVAPMLVAFLALVKVGYTIPSLHYRHRKTPSPYTPPNTPTNTPHRIHLLTMLPINTPSLFTYYYTLLTPPMNQPTFSRRFLAAGGTYQSAGKGGC